MKCKTGNTASQHIQTYETYYKAKRGKQNKRLYNTYEQFKNKYILKHIL